MQNIFEDFIQSLSLNQLIAKRLNLQGKKKEGNDEIQFDISLQQINHFTETFILLHIEKISEEKIIQQLKDLDEYKTTLLAKVAHDIRNPINTIDYLIKETQESIYTQTDNVKCRDLTQNNLTLMKSSIFFLMFLVNDIMDFCQYKQNKIKYVVNEIQVFNYLQKIKNLIEVQTKLKELTFVIKNLIKEDKYIFTDRNRLTQVILNLVSNAIKFTNKSGQIILQIEQINENLLKFEVQDNGSGMTDEIKGKITEPFQSYGNQVNQNQQGIGLGLHISKEIIKTLGPNKSFIIESKVDEGTSFSFMIYTNLSDNLIQAEEDLEIMTISQSHEINSIYDFQISSINKNCKCILIADDDPYIVFLLANIIKKKYPFCTILKSSNGKEAIEQFKMHNRKISNQNINLILMDCNMPIVDGYEASIIIKTLIKDEEYQSTIIIGNSGIFQETDQKAAFESGMDDLLLKPANENQILLKIAKYL